MAATTTTETRIPSHLPPPHTSFGRSPCDKLYPFFLISQLILFPFSRCRFLLQSPCRGSTMEVQ